MTTALWLMLVQGLLGAFDTIYYHEFRARLPAGGHRTRLELILHALRDFIYAALFCSLPLVRWQGAWAAVLATLLVAEIVITMADFVVEVRAREPVGVLPGERVTHGLMAIVYGAFLAHLVPELWDGWRASTACVAAAHDGPPWLTLALVAMGAGVFLSGVRDCWAALELPGGAFPWRRDAAATQAGSGAGKVRSSERPNNHTP